MKIKIIAPLKILPEAVSFRRNSFGEVTPQA